MVGDDIEGAGVVGDDAVVGAGVVRVSIVRAGLRLRA